MDFLCVQFHSTIKQSNEFKELYCMIRGMCYVFLL